MWEWILGWVNLNIRLYTFLNIPNKVESSTYNLKCAWRRIEHEIRWNCISKAHNWDRRTLSDICTEKHLANEILVFNTRFYKFLNIPNVFGASTYKLELSLIGSVWMPDPVDMHFKCLQISLSYAIRHLQWRTIFSSWIYFIFVCGHSEIQISELTACLDKVGNEQNKINPICLIRNFNELQIFKSVLNFCVM